jgi:hypothetical protein
MEKIKNWIRENKRKTAGLIALVFVLFYYLYTKLKGSSGQDAIAPTLTGAEGAQSEGQAEDIYTPPAGAQPAPVMLPAVNPAQFYEIQANVENQNKIAQQNATNMTKTIADLESNRATNILLNTYLQGGVGTNFAGGFGGSVAQQGGLQSLAESLAGVAHVAQPTTITAMPTGTQNGQRVTVPQTPSLLPTTPASQIALIQKIGAKPTEATGTTNLANAVSGFIAGGPIGAVIGGVANTIGKLFKKWF